MIWLETSMGAAMTSSSVTAESRLRRTWPSITAAPWEEGATGLVRGRQTVGVDVDDDPEHPTAPALTTSAELETITRRQQLEQHLLR